MHYPSEYGIVLLKIIIHTKNKEINIVFNHSKAQEAIKGYSTCTKEHYSYIDQMTEDVKPIFLTDLIVIFGKLEGVFVKFLNKSLPLF